MSEWRETLEQDLHFMNGPSSLANRRLRIGVIVSRFPRASETFIFHKISGLIARGHEVTVVTGCSSAVDWAAYASIDSVDGVRCRVHAPRTTPVWRAVPAAVLSLISGVVAAPLRAARYLRRGWRLFGPRVIWHFHVDKPLVIASPDVVLFEFGTLAVGRTYLGKLLDCRLIASFRGYDLNFSVLERHGYYDETWRGLDGVHFLGNHLKRRATELGLPSSTPYILVPPATDTEFFSCDRQHVDIAGTAKRPLRILSIGRLEWKKGYEFALEAVAELRQSGMCVEYRIVGEGEYREALAFARHQLGLEDCAILLGAVDRAAVREQMQWADVLLHAAVSEAFCNAVVEAQSMMLPVVTTDAGGLPENVADQVTGFIVPRRDARALAHRIEVLARDPALRLRFGMAGRARACSLFRIEGQLDAFEAFYRKVIAGGNRVESTDTVAAAEGACS